LVKRKLKEPATDAVVLLIKLAIVVPYAKIFIGDIVIAVDDLLTVSDFVALEEL
jgi:hypothetical protein